MRHQGQSGRRAFSFLESMVVMLIIILLASIVIPAYLGRGNGGALAGPKLPVVEEKVEHDDSGGMEAGGRTDPLPEE